MVRLPDNKTKKVLMIARAFPPFQSVGHSIRVVKFIKYLPTLGWLPSVLTIDDQKEYEFDRKQSSETLLSEIAKDVPIYRTFAGEPSLKYLEKERKFGQRNLLTRVLVKVLGGARRWSFRNLFLPDQRIVWLPFAVRLGRQIVKRDGIDVIFATCPPHSAIFVGVFLKLLTHKPLILDYRDDWIDTPWYCSKPAIRRWIELRLESWAVKTANKVILVTEWSRKAFKERYPTQPEGKFIFISNGCDLGDFNELKSITTAPNNLKFTIVHAGFLNVSKFWGRSPAGFFQAIQKILQEHLELKENLIIKFAGDLPEEFQKLAYEMGLSDVIQGMGHLPHFEVLRLIKSADLLLAINYDGWTNLIPGKIYEYWAVGGSPILLLSCPGAASEFVEQHNLGYTVEPYDLEGMHRVLQNIYLQSKTATPFKIKTNGIEEYDRQSLTRQLAQVLSMVI
jgi:glycosyltransferase involved in cell wall biosynthesis